MKKKNVFILKSIASVLAVILVLSLGLCSCSSEKLNLGDKISNTSSLAFSYPNGAKGVCKSGMIYGNVEIVNSVVYNSESASGIQLYGTDSEYPQPVEEVHVNDMSTEMFILVIVFIAMGFYQIFVPVPLHVLIKRLDIGMPVPEEEFKVGFELSLRSILGIVMVLVGVALFFIYII